eukprot:TRINITY_DN90283_c0_g1_i1.p1 TRINITY_DN90283_c0_g1~~TRINITY_DN90283_c0_g1_i1.p1  ORF type:complete len:190 (-),score=37.04 TRINITY_DN90283_c0_g1_i1:521-1090(-)
MHAGEIDKPPPIDASDQDWADFLVFQAGRNAAPYDDLPPQPAEVSPGVYLGGVAEALNDEVLSERGISGILNMAPSMCGPSSSRGFPDAYRTLDIDAEDSDGYDLFSEDVPEALNFIDEALAENRKVFVHCFAGMNRSATICAAWMMRTEKRPLLEVVRHLARQRGLVLQNMTFVNGLAEMARQHGLLR